ncbi:MAG: NADH-quinone oxidoreductase subunit J [Candidatus Marinimicrobia bacterium]|jgi:NADH-quinone oxidoreductase subunit J|nr:NADH-quinone oxidoreductase subunit J [Candidatus Neomarinimicrobiota bacterium]MBT3495673.1 NADH-quinone oxidoreductase subunit J [Candidatus Neomarinimicrobiota bacterium]MBT3693102.1 NADH-quinone oxidoreductase subunit J [Candidatus Neomarinimicrobiota bacterium]MBT3731539.1 NADH-quinone oxidoreductase subunit J [Candidatus Neomarinimicrobiota bacterium]MBT4143991.1 NADH-quinone oxidoreductase subunit J [Candidatus Neomarinimicrobiota bacterium]
MSEFAFWMVAALTIISAGLVVFSGQLIYSAVALLFTLLGVAGLYVFLWADFMAGVQVMVYIGGILVLIVFGIMLTHKIVSVKISQTNVQRRIGGFAAGLFLVILISAMGSASWFMEVTPEPVETVRTIGILLMTKYLLPFEAASLLLLGALIGAAMLSRKEN